MNFEFRLDATELDRIVYMLNVNKEDVVTAIAFEVEATAKTMAPVRTGALRNSIYTLSKRRSSRPQTMSGREYEALPAPEGDVIAVVGACVSYAAYVEFGTHRMGPRPYLTPAMEKAARDLNDGTRWKRLFEK